MAAQVEVPDVKRMLLEADPALWSRLAERTRAATGFADLLVLSSLRKKAQQRGVVREVIAEAPLRLALVGGYSLYPLSELLEHCLDMAGMPITLYAGDYDNYTSELTDPASELHAFAPQVVCILPSPRLAQSSRSLLDSRAAIEVEARGVVDHLLGLCAAAHERSRCEVVLANFPLPGRHDLGAFRGRTLASDWTFRKFVNLELGLRAPAYVRVWDVEFITNRRGALNAADDRAWFESKQPGSPDLLVDLAHELVNVVTRLRRPPKKVLVLDLDNTLWGGVVGDDGLEGIEIGDTSPRGEAFKAFQRYVKALKERGVLLAVCSKNDHAKAVEPFEKHPEMVLRMADFAAFYANWEPKGNNIRRMAAELNLGLDSFVFVDDNAAEIENVRQFAPDVTGIHLGADPAEYGAILQDCRVFEPSNITADDAQRTGKYKVELERKQLLASSADMDTYLASLEMEGTISALVPVDVPRVSQLINKSNQFNLTTRRRTEAEVAALIGAPGYACFSVRLKDRFGDHGLIGVGIGYVDGAEMVIDTWLMSCRVLKRQVEDEVLNEFARLAAAKGCSYLRGVYRPTPKNDMVKGHYPQLGFRVIATAPEQSEFSLDLASFNPRPTHIRVSRAA